MDADVTVVIKCFTETQPPSERKLFARPDQAVPSGVLIWRDSSLALDADVTVVIKCFTETQPRPRES
jgi:hypothetical protein